MSSYIYESVERENDLPLKAFITGIKSSSFHWHYEYEIISVLKGKITLRYGSKVSELSEGDIVLVNSRTIHSIYSDTENTCMVIQLGPEFFYSQKNKNASFNFYLDSAQNTLPPKCSYSKFTSRVAKIVQGYQFLNDEKHPDRISNYRIRAEVLTLIADIMDYVEYDVSFQVNSNNSDLQNAIIYIDYMKDHLADFDVLGDLCENHKISRKTLDRNIQSCVSLSPKALLDILRTDKAKNLLIHSDKTTSFIIDDCGFGSEKTFYRIFKEQTGMTPLEFRDKGKTDLYKNLSDQLRSYLQVENDESEKLLQQFLDNLENN